MEFVRQNDERTGKKKKSRRIYNIYIHIVVKYTTRGDKTRKKKKKRKYHHYYYYYFYALRGRGMWVIVHGGRHVR